MYLSVLWLVMWVPRRLLMKRKSCCDFSLFLPARSGHVHHTGYVGKYGAGQIYYKHAGCAACDHPWVSYRGFVVLTPVGDMGTLSFRKPETKSQKEERGGGQSADPQEGSENLLPASAAAGIWSCTGGDAASHAGGEARQSSAAFG